MCSKIIIFTCMVFILVYTEKCNSIFTLTKCCPLGEQINSDNDCEYIGSNITKIETKWRLNNKIFKGNPNKSYIESIPEAIISNNTNMTTAPMLPCHYSKVRSMIWTPKDADFIISGGTGELTSREERAGGQADAGEYCLDTVRGGDQEGESIVALTCPCLKTPCVNVCCQEGQILDARDNTTKCVDAPAEWSDWSVESVSVAARDQNFSTWYGAKPESGLGSSCHFIYLGDPGMEVNFTVLANGTLYYQEKEHAYWIPPKEFCISPIIFNETTEVNVLTCIKEDVKEQEAQKLHAAIYCTLFVIGALFLLATLLVHAALPELRRNVRGLSLMAHCTCMLVAHVALTIVLLVGANLDDVPCHMIGVEIYLIMYIIIAPTLLFYYIHNVADALATKADITPERAAYVIQFSLLAGFTWMNVMCIDIAATFRSLQAMLPPGRYEGQRRKFLYYSLYAMGLPLFMFVVTISANHSVLPKHLHPSFGVYSCWFRKDTYSILFYFYGPIGLLLLFNFALFIFAGFRIVNFVRESSILNQSGNHLRISDRRRFILLLKLFALMGVPWIMELVSWGVGGEDWWWYATDAFNLLRSVLIFAMFCCKTNVLALLNPRYQSLVTRISQITSRFAKGGNAMSESRFYLNQSGTSVSYNNTVDTVL